MKGARAADLVALAAAWLGSAPPALQSLFWRSIPLVPLPLPLLNMICTNVPGSPAPLYSVGRRMIASYPQVPTGYELGIGCAAQSYDGKIGSGSRRMPMCSRCAPAAGFSPGFSCRALPGSR